MTPRVVPEPAVWGIGRVVVGGEVVPWRVSAADVADEADAAATHLAGMGVGKDGLVLIVALLSQAMHAVPFEKGAGLLGARYSSADATEADAFRTAALVQQLSPNVVMGIDGRVVEGLRALGRDLAETFAEVGVVVTTDEAARAALDDAGLAPRRWLRVGPTSAVECRERAGAHLDGERWLAEPGDGGGGGVLLTSRVPRLTSCERLATGVVADVVEDMCPCRRGGPRLVPSA